MLPLPVREAAAAIGQFYLNKNKGDYVATEKELTDLRITKLEINANALCITTERVGMLVGRRGSNIDALSKFIQNQMQMKVRIIEDTDCLYDALIPRKDNNDPY